jgi:hypothetical protein
MSSTHRVVTSGQDKIPIEIDCERLRDLWGCADLTIMDIAWALDAYHREVILQAKKMGLGRRPAGVKTGQIEHEPTEDEIRERAAHIRATRWTKEEYEVRLQRVDKRWEAPVVPLTTFTGGH